MLGLDINWMSGSDSEKMRGQNNNPMLGTSRFTSKNGKLEWMLGTSNTYIYNTYSSPMDVSCTKNSYRDCGKFSGCQVISMYLVSGCLFRVQNSRAHRLISRRMLGTSRLTSRFTKVKQYVN